MHPRALAFLAAVALLTTSASALAERPFPPEDLPPQLEAWVPWVMDELPERDCATVSGSPLCMWPGELVLDLGAQGGSFSVRVRVDAEGPFLLPGSTAHWPQNVKVDNRPAVVLAHDDHPSLLLSPGEHTVRGDLVWTEIPEGIHIPVTTGIVRLSLEGEEIPFPRRDADGLLWLQSTLAEGQEGERLDVEVFRQIADGIPMTVTTRIVMRASGKAREVDLGPALLDGTTIMRVDSGVPARVDKEGHLRVQVRAGTHEATLVARTNGSPEKISSKARPEPWPGEEIWVWKADELTRQVSLTGAPGIDPSRTNLPKEWNGLPAFLVAPDGALTLNTTRRGEPDPPPDAISLDRTYWLDLDGEGYTVRDEISGELNRTWRLDLLADGELGHVSVNGVDQLITENPETKKPGVELRKGALRMTAEWRMDDPGDKLPAVGWSEDVQSLSATMHLPPGWTYIHDTQVDELPNTWWDEWDLFNFFFVILMALAVGKLTRWYHGIITLFALVLIHNEAELPLVVFISVSLLVFLGLLKVLPKGKLHLATRICWWVSVGILVIFLVPFSVTQARLGLYPQIEEEGSFNDFEEIPGFAMSLDAAEPMYEMGKKKEMVLPSTAKEVDEEGEVSGGKLSYGIKGPDDVDEPMEQQAMVQDQVKYDKRKVKVRGDIAQIASALASSSSSGWDYSKGYSRKALQQDPKAVVQTGPGVPNWSWETWHLSWSGPVDKDHRIAPILLGPKANLVISFLRIILLAILALVLVREAVLTNKIKLGELPPPEKNKKNGKTKTSNDKKTDKKAVAKAGAAATVVALALTFSAQAPAMEEPTADMLMQLQEKLSRTPDCLPDGCVSASTLRIAVDDDSLTLSAEVHVGAPVSWRIPGPTSNWVPSRVLVDGRQSTALATMDDGFLHLRLEPGRHVVTAEGISPPNDAVTLELGDLPRLVSADAPGWTVDGIRDDGRAETSIQLSRVRTSETDEGPAAFDENSYPPWLEVNRTLDLGIPWLVHTTVRRVSPTGSPVMEKIPLLPGESVTESELQVEEGNVLLSMGRDDTQVSWSSTLTESPDLELTAPEGRPWTEVWVLSCSPMWQCEHEGLTPISHKGGGELRPTFKPWPGEKVTLKMVRPGGVDGQSVTIDSAHLEVSPGIRLMKASLDLSIRSSQGGVQTVTLPAKASIQTLTVNGAERPFRQDGEKLEITLSPGHQSIHLEWQQPGGITSSYEVPKVDLGGPAANVKVTVDMPSDRWLVWTTGPSWGPAILFWGYLLIIIFAGLIMGFFPLSPLKSWQWMLLVLGLTQIPVGFALVVVVWFFLLSWRKKRPPAHFFWHNTMQIFIGLWTLVSIGVLFGAVYSGLAVQLDMQVSGAGSYDTHLIWYLDRVDGVLPQPSIFSLPDMVWKGIMMAWSLWLVWSLVRWSRWGWKAFSHETLWRSIPKPKPAASAEPENDKEEK